MVSIRLISRLRDGGTRIDEVQAQPGQTVMQAAVEAGIQGIAAECGGMVVCATCHVYVAPEWAARLPAADEDELAMLECVAAERRAGSRLSCQITPGPEADGLTVELPERQY
jgi:2Fe-2S ferredoxin